MHYERIRSGKIKRINPSFGTPLDEKSKQRNLDKFRGCLIGGAAGDALGYAVEFYSENKIFHTFGPEGITQYRLDNGRARFSDDTQMTLFTANGLLFADTRLSQRGIKGSYPSYISGFYREWLRTQQYSFSRGGGRSNLSWLMNVPELFVPRAPGNTCLSAIEQGCRGTVEDPINDSKGCGGVMRVAPVGLYLGQFLTNPLAIDLMGADVAALTHGHEMGYIPAALLVHIVRLVSHCEDVTLEEAVLDGMKALELIFPEAKHLPEFLKLIQKAVDMAKAGTDDLTAIHALGPGWVGDEALAVAVFCALKYSHDFDRALIAAVNHGGDSDSTGAITGNILGAYLGLAGIPRKYTEDLECLDVLTEIADDLYYGCQLNEYTNASTPRDIAWESKYVRIDYRPSRD